MNVKPFGILPAIAILILSVGLVNHVISVPMLLGAAHRDAWMCVWVAMLILLPWTAIPLFGALKKMKQIPIDQWLLQRLHPVFVWLLITVFLADLLLIAYETLIVTSSWTATTYLPNTPTFVIEIVFLALCLFAASSGLRTIAYMSCLLLPLVVLLGDFVMSTNMPHKDYRYLLPMLENGISPVIQGANRAITAFSELFTLLFIQHHIKGTFKRWHLILLVLFLALLTFGPITGAISEFGPAEAENMRYPAFSQWRLVSIGRYLEHVDFFAVFQWLSGALIRLSLAIHIIAEFGPVRRLKRKWISTALLAIVLAVPAYFGTKNMMLYRLVQQWTFSYLGLFMVFLVVCVWGASFLKKKQGNKQLKKSDAEEIMQ